MADLAKKREMLNNVFAKNGSPFSPRPPPISRPQAPPENLTEPVSLRSNNRDHSSRVDDDVFSLASVPKSTLDPFSHVSSTARPRLVSDAHLHKLRLAHERKHQKRKPKMLHYADVKTEDPFSGSLRHSIKNFERQLSGRNRSAKRSARAHRLGRGVAVPSIQVTTSPQHGDDISNPSLETNMLYYHSDGGGHTSNDDLSEDETSIKPVPMADYDPVYPGTYSDTDEDASPVRFNLSRQLTRPKHYGEKMTLKQVKRNVLSRSNPDMRATGKRVLPDLPTKSSTGENGALDQEPASLPLKLPLISQASLEQIDVKNIPQLPPSSGKLEPSEEYLSLSPRPSSRTVTRTISPVNIRNDDPSLEVIRVHQRERSLRSRSPSPSGPRTMPTIPGRLRTGSPRLPEKENPLTSPNKTTLGENARKSPQPEPLVRSLVGKNQPEPERKTIHGMTHRESETDLFESVQKFKAATTEAPKVIHTLPTLAVSHKPQSEKGKSEEEKAPKDEFLVSNSSHKFDSKSEQDGLTIKKGPPPVLPKPSPRRSSSNLVPLTPSSSSSPNVQSSDEEAKALARQMQPWLVSSSPEASTKSESNKKPQPPPLRSAPLADPRRTPNADNETTPSWVRSRPMPLTSRDKEQEQINNTPSVSHRRGSIMQSVAFFEQHNSPSSAVGPNTPKEPEGNAPQWKVELMKRRASKHDKSPQSNQVTINDETAMPSWKKELLERKKKQTS